MKIERLLWKIFISLRPKQWMKNFALFAGLLLAPLDNLSLTWNITWVVIQAFIIFCATSSATYILNDIFDLERDRLHPFKKYRPIAAGDVPVWLAMATSLGLMLLVILLSFKLSTPFFLAVLGYLILQLLYSSYLKSVILLDVITIAAGFVLRVYAGVWVINAHLNVWFLLTITSFALFIAIGKRRSELTLLKAKAAQHRETLSHYPETLLDVFTAMFANSTWLAYALFTSLATPIVVRPKIENFLNDLNIPHASANKYLMVTIPVVIYGVMRYLYIIYEKKEAESPENVLLTDMPLLATVILWLAMLVVIIFYIGI